MTRAEAPRVYLYEALPFRHLAGAVPLAILGCVVSGLISSVFYTLIPGWMQGEGIEQGMIGLIMLVAVLGGLAFQIPIGRLSDRFDRRSVLAAVSLGLTATAVSSTTSAAYLVGRLASLYLARRLHVDIVSDLRCLRARPNACRSSSWCQQSAHSDQRYWIRRWTVHWNVCYDISRS